MDSLTIGLIAVIALLVYSLRRPIIDRWQQRTSDRRFARSVKRAGRRA